MTFLQLYGEELSLQLSSDDTDTNGLFPVTRRKAQVNAGMREFVRLTECVKKTGSIPIVDGTAAYDLEATLTDFWMLSDRDGVVLEITDGDGTVRRLVEGRDLFRTDKRRLDRERAGWRDAEPGTPRAFYLDDEGGTTLLGFYPAPDLADDETAVVKVPYVPHVADMVADADEPYTFSSNAVLRLRPWHLAPVHWAAYKLEWARKQYGLAKEQLALFSALVKDYHDKQRVPGGDVVAYAHDYIAGTRRPGAFAGDGMVDW